MAAAVDDATKAKLMEVFTTLDRNGSLQIDQREVEKLVNKLLNRNMDDMAIAEIMSEINDSDAPGQGIDFDSFVRALAPVASASEAELNDMAFTAMDADGSGCISVAELSPLMSAVAGGMSEASIKTALELAAGKDGKLRKEEPRSEQRAVPRRDGRHAHHRLDRLSLLLCHIDDHAPQLPKSAAEHAGGSFSRCSSRAR